MKKETIIWQVIIFVLGLMLILTIRTYLKDKNEIMAETSRTNCLISAHESGASVPCMDIKTYKLQDSAKGF